MPRVRPAVRVVQPFLAGDAPASSAPLSTAEPLEQTRRRLDLLNRYWFAVHGPDVWPEWFAGQGGAV